MRKIIEYTLLSADGVFEDPARLGYRALLNNAGTDASIHPV